MSQRNHFPYPKEPLMNRHLLRLAGCCLAAAAIACQPPIDTAPAPSKPAATAVFDPTATDKIDIPLPNDLVFQGDLSKQPLAQQELLGVWGKVGYPNDQEVPVTIDFTRGGKPVSLDLTTLIPNQTLLVVATTAAGSGPVQIDAPAAADYVLGSDRGTLTIHNKGRQPWAPGQYSVIVRGGPNGVKTTDGDPVYASQVFYLLANGAGQDLSTEQNITLIYAQTGDMAQAVAQAKQLNSINFLYAPVYAAADKVFPHQQIAVLTTFKIEAAATQVELDANRGLVPLPIDLLRDPRAPTSTCAACGKLTGIAACTLAGGTYTAATDSCSSPGAAGFRSLDGFSTTAAMIASTNSEILASTVNPGTVYLYDLTNPAAPVQVATTTLIYEPSELTQSGLSTAVVLQPSGATAGDSSSVFRSRPLKDNTNYAVVITDGVKDKTGAALSPGTAARILLFDNPVNVSGSSTLAGIDDLTTGALEVMRQRLKPVLGVLPVSKAHVAMAYTFKTQSILGTAVQLASLPYGFLTGPASYPVYSATSTPAAAFAKYGLNPGRTPSSHIAEVIEAKIITLNLLDPVTGAFQSNPANATSTMIDALITVPFSAATSTPLPYPVMVFRHGLGGGRADMLHVADTFAANGLITIAIDAAKHGDRSFCSAGDKTTTLQGNSFNVCSDAAACVAIPTMVTEGDLKPPGMCAAGFTYRPVDSECSDPGTGCGWTGKEGIPVVSSNFLISANFFRTRDTFRQDIIDESQLIRALAINPANGASSPVFAQLAAAGVVADPTRVYFSGQSLGSIQGAASVAANPRITKAALNVGGGTAVDVFTTSPAFATGVGQLEASLGIAPGTAAYFQFLIVAKTVLDPADPINYLGHITDGSNTLPSFITGTAQPAKKLLTQAAYCDQTVPNPWNYLFASVAGTGPTPAAGATGFNPFTTGTFELFYTYSNGTPDLTTCPLGVALPPSSAVEHGFVTNWNNPAMTKQAQQDIAAFVVSDTHPTSLQLIPAAN
jgi:hypothetical protein